MSSMMSWGWRPSTLQPTDWTVPRIYLFSGSRELSSQRSVPPLSGNVDDLIKSGISTVLNVFLLLSVSWWFFEGVEDQGRGRRRCLNLDLSVLNGQFHCDLQPLPVTGCFGNVVTNLFWRQAQGVWPWVPGQMWLPTSAPQVSDFDLVEVKFQPHGGSGWCWMNLDSGPEESCT